MRTIGLEEAGPRARLGVVRGSVFGGALAVAAGAVGLAGCPQSGTTSIYTPVTGILIRSSTLVAGHGCGTAPGQVYRYAALVYYASDASDGGTPIVPAGAPPAGSQSSVFDCFADGLFSNLVASPTGSLSFSVAIYAFNFAAYPPALNCQPPVEGDGNVICPGDNPATLLGVVQGNVPTWTTTCDAVQQSGVSVLAVCRPLVPTAAAGGVDAGSDADESGDAADSGAVGESSTGDGDTGEASGDGAGADAAPEGGGDAAVDAEGDSSGE
jgi:hypothetical protein